MIFDSVSPDHLITVSHTTLFVYTTKIKYASREELRITSPFRGGTPGMIRSVCPRSHIATASSRVY